jgi:hypothetical protein
VDAITYDAAIAYDTAAYTYDGLRIGGGVMDLSALLQPGTVPRLTDRDAEDGPEPHGELTRGWHRRRVRLV